MSRVRITFTLEEIKTLCNALLWVDYGGAVSSGPTSFDPSRLDAIKDICYNAKGCLTYAVLGAHPGNNVEVVE